MRPFYELIRRLLVTEKAVREKERRGRYTFEVSPEATKPMIRRMIESHFGVKVLSVRTEILHGKVRRVGRHHGRRPNWKKAVVALAPGQKIEALETT